MSIREKLNKDTVLAMKNKDKELVNTLRLVKALIQNEEIKTKSELNDEEVIKMISRELKQTKESILGYQNANNPDKVKELETRINVLTSYLPAQLNEGEIKDLISNLISDNGIQGKQDKGKLMKLLMPQVKGKADGALVNKIVGELLQ